MRPKLSVSRLHQLVALQETLLADATRNRAFFRALRMRVRPSTSVLDIGAGTGLWAIAAAKLGARRVVAVEREPLLIPVIERLAEENGVRGRMEIVCADSRKARLRGRFDLVVSETVGSEAFDEGILEILRDARRRFLRRGGRFLPEALTLLAAPVRSSGLRPRAPIRAAYLESLAVHFPRGRGHRRLRILAAPRPLVRVDLGTAPAAIGERGVSWRVGELARVNAIAVWVEMGLAPGVRLSTLSGTHWTPSLLGVEPLGRGPGRLALRVRFAREGGHWEVAAGGRNFRYSSLFAYGAVRAALRR